MVPSGKTLGDPAERARVDSDAERRRGDRLVRRDREDGLGGGRLGLSHVPAVQLRERQVV